MARAGLNKHLVQQARDAIQARGQHPSLDAVRIELGNTGSKTTIHRYLKELEAEEGTRLDDMGLLSETLKGMVSRLAARLHEEAQAIVEESRAQHAAQIGQMQVSIQELQTALARSQEDCLNTTSRLTTEQQNHHIVLATLEHERIRSQRLEEQVRGLEVRLQEGEAHRQSLEEKHQHAREALEHYRQSVKEQRDQDQRRHETQLQQVQAEQRTLQQTLITKQTETTQLNRDNERLVTELRDAQRLSHQQERLAAQLELALKTTQASLAQIEGLVNASRQDAVTLQAELQTSMADGQRMAALLADTDIVRLLTARQAGHPTMLIVNAPEASNNPAT